jgi:ABC-type branched-subunit amino acid transport system ATPase component
MARQQFIGVNNIIPIVFSSSTDYPQPTTSTMTSTYHTYPDLVYDKGRLAETIWDGNCFGDAIAATLTINPEVIILRARIGNETIKGLAPGGLA